MREVQRVSLSEEENVYTCGLKIYTTVCSWILCADQQQDVEDWATLLQRYLGKIALQRQQAQQKSSPPVPRNVLPLSSEAHPALAAPASPLERGSRPRAQTQLPKPSSPLACQVPTSAEWPASATLVVKTSSIDRNANVEHSSPKSSHNAHSSRANSRKDPEKKEKNKEPAETYSAEAHPSLMSAEAHPALLNNASKSESPKGNFKSEPHKGNSELFSEAHPALLGGLTHPESQIPQDGTMKVIVDPPTKIKPEKSESKGAEASTKEHKGHRGHSKENLKLEEHEEQREPKEHHHKESSQDHHHHHHHHHHSNSKTPRSARETTTDSRNIPVHADQRARASSADAAVLASTIPFIPHPIGSDSRAKPFSHLLELPASSLNVDASTPRGFVKGKDSSFKYLLGSADSHDEDIVVPQKEPDMSRYIVDRPGSSSPSSTDSLVFYDFRQFVEDDGEESSSDDT